MARIPPWRWNLWGPWPPDDGPTPPIPDALIRPIADRLGKQRPWHSQDENWLAAERALRQKPWRPWVIRFSGEKERSGWDWADLLLKVSVPVLILGLSTAYSIISADRQEKIAKAEKERQEAVLREQDENDTVKNFFKEMQPLLIDKGLRSSPPDSEVRGVARGLTLAALSRVKDPLRKWYIVRFLFDSGLNEKPGTMINLSEADLEGAYLIRADLRGANLSGANLREAALMGADLRGANLFKADLGDADLSGAKLMNVNLREANLMGANLNKVCIGPPGLKLADGCYEETALAGADLRGAYLSEANMTMISWDKNTRWPEDFESFRGAYVPERLKKQLGIPEALLPKEPWIDD